MGTTKTAAAAGAGKTKGWRLGDNTRFMAWVKAEAERLAVPRLDIATKENVSDLRILFVALYPYQFTRFEKKGVKLLKHFTGFHTDTIAKFRTLLIFTKLKLSEMKSETMDQICEYFGVAVEDDKAEQIDKFVNLISRPENTGLSAEKQKLLLTLSKIENVKIPGGHRRPPMVRSSPAAKRPETAARTPSQTKTPTRKRKSKKDGEEEEEEEEISDDDYITSDDDDDGHDDEGHDDDDDHDHDDDDSDYQSPPARSEKTRSRSSRAKKTIEERSESPKPPKSKRSKKEASNKKAKRSPKKGASDNDQGDAELPNDNVDDKTHCQLRVHIEEFFKTAPEDVTMRMVKEHLHQYFDKEALATYKTFIKSTVMEIFEQM